MKIIDLLNRIANGEELPKKIKYEGDIWELNTLENTYDNGECCLFEDYIDKKYLITDVLNDEVEIIEEDKKDKDKDKEIEIYINGEKIELFDYEPLKQGEYFYKENGKWYVHKLKNVSKIIEEDKKIKKLPYYDYKEITSENNRDKFIEKLLEKHDKRLNDYHEKIDEIIDYLNKEE